jgi:ubiquinone/menaquinone biosynthesis C-methylase UbiE
MREEDYHLDKIYRVLADLDSFGDMPVLPVGCRSVLDVGCGAGQTLFTFGNHRDLTQVGIDSDPKAVALGRTFWPWSNFVCASGEQLPFNNDCFDFAFARVSLPYMRLRVALGELNRVLRPGAGLWIALHPPDRAISRILTVLAP